MGYVALPPPGFDGQIATIEAELDHEEFKELVTRLTSAVNSLQLQSRQLADLPNGDGASPPSTSQKILELPKQDDFSFSQGASPSSATPEATPSIQRSANSTAPLASKSQQAASTAQPKGFKESISSGRPLHSEPPVIRGPNALKWREIWRSEAVEHDNLPVTALAYVPATESLMGGSSPGGWLLSASDKLLNLWECFPGRGDVSLQVMHSQMTDFEHIELAADLKEERMLSTCKERNREYCVSLFSLSKTKNMLAPRHGDKLNLPPKGVMKGFSGTPSPKVKWLHDFGGPLQNTLATSYNEHIAIFSIISPHQTKACWQAHQSPITQIHVNDSDVCLFSADKAGEISKWELRAKPKSAADTYTGFSQEVTGLHQISSHTLLATSLNGYIAAWDLRNSRQPLKTTTLPDQGGAAATAFNPVQGLYAVTSTLGQLFTFEETEGSFQFQEVQQQKKAPNPSRAIAWNSRTCQLYSIDHASIAVYSKD